MILERIRPEDELLPQKDLILILDGKMLKSSLYFNKVVDPGYMLNLPFQSD